MEAPGNTVANLVTFLLSVIFLVESVTCPSTDKREEVGLFGLLSKVIVRKQASEIVHVYNNAVLYTIKRPLFVTEESSDIKWFTIRVRKSSEENFRTLVDICGMQVEFLLLTQTIVKMMFNEEYEYTLHFDEVAHAANFVNDLYETSKKRGIEIKYRLSEAAIVRNDGGSEVIETSAKLTQRVISNQISVFYVRSSDEEIRIMFPSRHFLINVDAPKEVSITPMVVKGQPLDYTYRLTFSAGFAEKAFFAFATNHQFQTGDAPDSEPQDTGNSDESLRSDGNDFYDEDELKFFHKTEANTDWNDGND